MQENVGLSLIHLLGDTDTLAEHTGGACAPVNLQDLTTRPSQRNRWGHGLLSRLSDTAVGQYLILQAPALAHSVL